MKLEKVKSTRSLLKYFRSVKWKCIQANLYGGCLSLKMEQDPNTHLHIVIPDKYSHQLAPRMKIKVYGYGELPLIKFRTYTKSILMFWWFVRKCTAYERRGSLYQVVSWLKREEK